MQNHEFYKSAMDKVSPSEGWEKDTLAKLAAARKEMEVQQCSSSSADKNNVSFSDSSSSGACKSSREDKTIRFPKIPKRSFFWVAAAAAFAIFLVPAAVQSLGSRNLDTMLVEQSAANKQPRAALFHDTLENDTVDSSESSLYGDLTSNPALKAFADAEGKVVNGLPVIRWFKEISGRGGTWEFLAKDESEIATKNPTFNLPGHQLPNQLPVWRAPSGPQKSRVLYERLQNAADFTQLALVQMGAEPCPEGYALPQLWPYYAVGELMDPDAYVPGLQPWEQPEPSVWEVSATQQLLVLSNSAPAPSERQSSVSEQITRMGCDMANAQLGGLVNIESPDYQIIPSVNLSGGNTYNSFDNFMYETGHPGDSIETQLLNYSFKRIYGSMSAGGGLDTAVISLMPETEPLGHYPVRSLSDAFDALDHVLAEDFDHGLINYEISRDNVINWQIEYYQSPMNAYILPIYVFTLETPLLPAETAYRFTGDNQYKVYVEYWVSALPDEYCVEWIGDRY